MSSNLHRIRLSVPGKPVWAVVKANAYGHGIEHALQGLQAADGLAMLDFVEAQRCRAAGWTKPILMLEGAFDRLDLGLANELSLSLVVHDEAGLDALELFSDPASSNFAFKNYKTAYWCSNPVSGNSAEIMQLDYNYADFYFTLKDKKSALSIRCIKN